MTDNIVKLSGSRKNKTTERRQAWAGGLTEAEQRLPGARMLSLLLQSANDRGLQLQELAAALGVTYGYMAQLRSGVRSITNVSNEFLRACAEFLELPVLTCMLASDKVRLEDMYAPDTLEQRINQAWLALQHDPKLCGEMPAVLDSLPTAAKLFILRLYDQATGRNLLGTPSTYDI